MPSERKPVQTKVKVSLAIERLEDRTVPAGNVTAFVQDGVLFVQGDELGNLVQVAKTGKRSAIVRSLGDDTTINGVAGGLWFGDITRGYDIKLNGGNDILELLGVDARKGLRVEGGDGNDVLKLANVKSRQDTDILGGAGNDDLYIYDSHFRRRVAIDMGAGDDRVNQERTKYARDTTVTGGPGTNTFAAVGTSFPAEVVVDGFNTRVSTPLPTAVPDTATVPIGGSVLIPVAANDLAPSSLLDPTSYEITVEPTKGTVTANGDGSVTYTNTGGDGVDTFRYRFRNVSGGPSNEGVVTITLLGQDDTPPTVTVVNNSGSSALSPIPFTIQFSENVTGFQESDLQITNGTIASFLTTNPSQYTVNVTPTADGPVVVTVPAGVAQDPSGNANTSATATVISIRTDAGMTDTPPAVNDPNWQIAPSGLGTWDIQQGSGLQVNSASNITVFYTGWLDDGTVFDSARDDGEPATFALANLIQGWQQGLIGMQPGGIRRLLIPPDLGYGGPGSPPNIPPNATLIFEIKLASVS